MAGVSFVLALLAVISTSEALRTEVSEASRQLSASAAATRTDSAYVAGANPIRRVVTMLQKMVNQVEAEGKKEQELFDKFMCYCKTSGGALEKSISDAQTKIPQLQSDIKASEGEHAQLEADIEKHQTDRDAAKAAMGKATSIREKQAAAFAKESGEDKSNIEAMTKAIAAISKGMAGGFLQSNSAAVLRSLSLSQDMSSVDRDMLSAFLSGGHGSGYVPASAEIVGILKQMKDTMEKDLAALIATEETARSDYDALMAAKTKEVEADQAALEHKMKRVGEVAVEIVNLKKDLEDTEEGLREDNQFLGDLKTQCATKEKEWEEVCKTRSEELVALAETIKILNDDDALELFKKTLPSPSLLQTATANNLKAVRTKALKALAAAHGKNRHHAAGLDFISLALQGKKVDFSKVISMIDDMVALLAKEQADDDHKKEYCEKQIDLADDKKKELEHSISDLTKAIDEDNNMIATLASEIKTLSEGIHQLDKEVVEATEQRKQEHGDYVGELAANTAAVQLIGMAKNRMQKFYNPKLYKPPPKRELSEEERITLNMGGTLAPTNAPGGIAGTGVSASFSQVAPPPPPESVPDYKKKSEESGGVLAMMDLLIAELEKEITEMEVVEKNAQEEYEVFVKDSAAKRADDSKSIADKEAAKAGLEADVVAATEKKTAESNELMATKEYISELHAECDWLLEKYQERKTARADEVDALKNAKAVLSGADFS